MFFSKLGRAADAKKGVSGAAAAAPSGQIKIKKVKVAVDRDAQTRPLPPAASRAQKDISSSRNSGNTSKVHKKQPSTVRKRKAPDLAKFNRIVDSTPESDVSLDTDNTPQRSLSPVPDNRSLYSGTTTGHVEITDSKSIASLASYTPCFESRPDLSFELALPCSDTKEVYVAKRPKSASDYDPVSEAELIMDLVGQNMVPEKYTREIKHPSLEDCIVRRYRRAIKHNDPEKFLASVEEYNALITKLRESGEISSHMSTVTRLPIALSRSLLNQVYLRIVSPRANELRDYEAFSNNVYGEIMPDFLTRLFRETGLTSSSVFVDLGSGVGNCTLQAALEVGCESWGCEVMKTASDLAAKQQHELEARAKLYGINLGKIELRSASFVHNDEIQKVVSRADVVLVNNYAFSGELNSSLIDMFLDLKEGCKIVSLKSFVPPGHVISEYNIESPLNILSVEIKELPSGSVSWTMNTGPYYITVVDRTKLQEFLARGSRRRGRS